MPKGVYLHEKGRVITWGDKISKSLIGREKTEEHKLSLSISHLGLPSGNKGKRGYKHTKESLQKIREASKGNQYCLGKYHSEETKRKQSEAGKRKPSPSIEVREKIRKTLTGKKRPEMIGENNPMFTHPNSYKSKFGKCGYREDIGIFVRSSWEANIYRIYKYLGLIMQYEPKSFILSDGRTYRPDFYIIDNDLWIEVKGLWLKEAYEKFLLFKKEYPNISIQVIDSEKYKEMIKKYKTLIYLEG